jgi:hypothetical protein
MSRLREFVIDGKALVQTIAASVDRNKKEKVIRQRIRPDEPASE